MIHNSTWNAAQLNSPVLAVDAVVLLAGRGLVLVQRRNPPFQHLWALPGGIVELGETVEEALIREVAEETGLEVTPSRLIGIFSDPTRDPRGHTVSVAFMASPIDGKLRPGTDAANVQAFPIIPEQLAFDHQRILKAASVIDGGEVRKSGSVDV